MLESNSGFFANGENLQNQIGKKFSLDDKQVDTEVFKNQNKMNRAKKNFEIIKKIFHNSSSANHETKKATILTRRQAQTRRNRGGFHVKII